MYDDDYVSSEPYRLMPPRRSAIREAIDAAAATGPEMREALDLMADATPEAVGGDAVAWPAPRHQWLRRFGRALARMDTWMLIVTTVAAIATIAGAWFAYLALVKS